VKLRCITITQPWCGLMVAGIKLIENRPRPIIPDSMFGQPIGFHASRTFDRAAMRRIIEIEPRLAFDHPESILLRDGLYDLMHTTSCVIGVGTPFHTLKGWGETEIREHRDGLREQLGDQLRWFFGPVGHRFRDMRRIAEPVACRGMLGCWTAPEDVERAVVRQLAVAA